MAAVAAGARVVAVDVSEPALRLAAELGASALVQAADFDGDPVRIGDALRDMTSGGVSLSLDAYGSLITSAASVYSLRRRGRHVQVGVLPPELGVPPLPMHRVMGWELEIVGSHGMAAHAYPEMLAAVRAGYLQPARLVTKRVPLEDVCTLLPAFSGPTEPGITVVEMGDEHATLQSRASGASATATLD